MTKTCFNFTPGNEGQLAISLLYGKVTENTHRCLFHILRAPPCWWQKQVKIRDWVSPFCGRSSAVGLVLTLGGTSLNFPPGTCLRCHKTVPPGSLGRLGWQLIQKLFCYRSLCLHLIQDSDSSSSSTTLSSGCVWYRSNLSVSVVILHVSNTRQQYPTS